MTRITRYFLTAYLKPLLFSYAALAVLVLVSELMEHLDKFIAGKAGVLLVAQYLALLLPTRTVEILPVAALLAALFSLGNLSHNKEVTAAMSGGIHPWKCVQPLLVVGFVLSVFSWGLGESVVPYTTAQAKRLWSEDIRHIMSQRPTRFENLTVAGEGSVFYSIGLLDTEAGRMENVVVDFQENGRPARQIEAKSAEWRDGVWIFGNGVERTFTEGGLEVGSQTLFEEYRPPLKEKPLDMVPREPDPEEMSYKQFNRHLRRLRVLGIPTRRQEVDLHTKLAFPWASFIVLLFGIPFAFQKAGGKVKAIGFALATAFVYFGLMQVGRALGQKPWCPPLLGAWLANLVFLAVGGWMFWRMKKLS